MNERSQTFKLEINSIEDFIIFSNIIRNKDINADEIKKLIKDINRSDSALLNAIENQKGESDVTKSSPR